MHAKILILYKGHWSTGWQSTLFHWCNGERPRHLGHVIPQPLFSSPLYYIPQSLYPTQLRADFHVLTSELKLHAASRRTRERSLLMAESRPVTHWPVRVVLHAGEVVHTYQWPTNNRNSFHPACMDLLESEIPEREKLALPTNSLRTPTPVTFMYL